MGFTIASHWRFWVARRSGRIEILSCHRLTLKLEIALEEKGLAEKAYGLAPLFYYFIEELSH